MVRKEWVVVVVVVVANIGRCLAFSTFTCGQERVGG